MADQYEMRECARCWGKGRYATGVCFLCGGAKLRRWNVSAAKRRETAAANAMKKGTANREAWMAANPALAALFTDPTLGGQFISDMRDSVFKYGKLTEKQHSAVEKVITERAARDAAREQAHAAAVEASSHQGTIGQRVDLSLTVKAVFQIESRGFGYNAGTVLRDVLIMEDATGNVYKWASSGTQGIQRGETVTLRGTVKDHSEYKGVKQTILTRCKVRAPAEAQVAA